jgi:MYXO-CTERM domain-containing protein
MNYVNKRHLGLRGPGSIAAWARFGVATAVLFATVSLAGTASAKSFIDYLKPTPITCSPLSSATWGVAGVLPRDTCNGIESAKGAGVPPEYYYWDGQIIKAKDGVYHMFMSTWLGTTGFQNWGNSESFHAVSTQGVLGPYTRKGYVWDSGSHHGHNTSAAELSDGSYAVVVSEVVPFTIYKSNSLDGPWTGCVASMQTNGIRAGTDGHYDSNVSLTARHDGKFEIVQRHGLIAIADTLCGPYKMQKPTWTYPAANLPQGIDSIYPHRTSVPDPAITNPGYAWEEDPHIWYSGGVYHVLYSGSGDRIGWHLYSADGVNNWKDDGLAFDPRMYQKIFCYEGSTTCTQWYKMERPGVVLEGGHVTHVTWAVADVDKDNQIPAGSNHGSKVIVVPFDGVAFDNDYGVKGSDGGVPADAGTGGTTGAGGASGRDGGGLGGNPSGGTGGTATGGTSGAAGAGGATSGNGGAGGSTTGSGAAGSGGQTGAGGTSGSAGGSSKAGGQSSGCACAVPGHEGAGGSAALLLVGVALLPLIRRRRCRRGFFTGG